MTNNVFVDTDILIDYSKGRTDTLNTLLTSHQESTIHLYTNPIVIAEFYRGIQPETKRHTNAQKLFSIFTVLVITKEIGLVAATIMRENQSSAITDALIAATCLVHKLQLATRNTKHFSPIAHLTFYSPNS